jgi:hypothetical protein
MGHAQGAAAAAQRDAVERRLGSMSTHISVARPHAMNYAARARWATVRIETDGHVYVGRLFIPETKKRLSEVLSDERPFLNLTEVSVDDGELVEPFVALNKRYVRTVRILDEGEAESVTAQPRRSD